MGLSFLPSSPDEVWNVCVLEPSTDRNKLVDQYSSTKSRHSVESELRKWFLMNEKRKYLLICSYTAERINFVFEVFFLSSWKIFYYMLVGYFNEPLAQILHSSLRVTINKSVFMYFSRFTCFILWYLFKVDNLVDFMSLVNVLDILRLFSLFTFAMQTSNIFLLIN